MTATIIGGILLLIVVFVFPKRKKTVTYSFQVYDNKGQYIYTKRITAKTEVEAETKIKNYIPHDYTYKLI